MDSNNETRKMILKPAKTSLKKPELKNGNSSTTSENGHHSFSFGNNPFSKCDKDETETVSETNSKEETKDDLFKPAKPNNLFTNPTTIGGFVFGQNLHERVVTDKVSTSTENHQEEKKETPGSELLFSNAILTNSSSLAVDASSNKTEEENESSTKTQPIPVTLSSKDQSSGDSNEKSNGEVPQTTEVSSSSSKNNLSLVEAARKYEEMKGAQKRKYEEVEVITGEEDEENILEINCKLYTFENSNYEERGRGTLRLNDTKNSSRVVFRAAGSYRVLLNTKVWGDQLCEKPSSKSMRLTAFTSDGLLKIYLVQGRNEDIENLFYELNRRIEKEKSKIEVKSEEEKPDEQKTNEIEPAPKKKLSSTDDE